MKKLYLFFMLILIVFNINAQVGLLSTNNKQIINNSSDTIGSKLPDIITNEVHKTYVRYSDLNIPNNYFNNDSLRYREISDTLDFLKSLLNQNIKNMTIKVDSIMNNIKNKNGVGVTKKNKILQQQINSVKGEIDSLSLLIHNKSSELDKIKKIKQKNDSVLTVLMQKNLSLTKRMFLNKLDTLFRNVDQFDDALSKSNFLSRHYAVDTAKKIIDNEKFTLSMADVYAALNKLSKKNDKAQNRLEKLQNDIDDIILIDSADDATNIISKLEANWKKIAVDTLNISTDYNKDTLTYRDVKNKYDKALKDYVIDKVTKQDAKQTDFGAFPQITSILGKKETIPSLQLYGSYNYENSTQSFEGNLGISIAPSNTPDTANLYSMFFPTSSKFLIHSNFTWSFLPVGIGNSDSAKKIGIKLDVSFASKNLIYDTVKVTKSFSSSLLYAKAGIEIGILPKRLSIYGNVNTATLLDQVDEFVNNTGIKSKFFGYLDCGSKLYLDPTPNAKIDDKLFIYANLNFVVNSGDVKRITKSNDLVIPSIQVGIVKTLGKF